MYHGNIESFQFLLKILGNIFDKPNHFLRKATELAELSFSLQLLDMICSLDFIKRCAGCQLSFTLIDEAKYFILLFETPMKKF